MSTLTEVLQPFAVPEFVEVSAAEREVPSVAEKRAWSADRFGEEQIQLLVRQLFFPGSSRPPRHVVFSAVDETTYVAEICMDAAKGLAAQVSGSVCAIEANPHNPELESVFASKPDGYGSSREGFGFLRSSSERITGNLWLAPCRLLTGSTEDGRSPAWLERRLADFRLEFDYTLLHAPTIGAHSETAVLARLSDGVALVLEANSTRRVTALKAKETLQAANARVLGMVLSERTFPIPEGIYRRL
jgi:hypothetical protein